MPTPKFKLPGSPLEGHHVPADWRLLDRNGKWRALVATGIAGSADEARSLLAAHAAAVKRLRRKQSTDTTKGNRYGS